MTRTRLGKKSLAAAWLAGLCLLACGADPSGESTGGGGTGGGSGESPDTGPTLEDSGASGTPVPPDTGGGGQPPPGGQMIAADAGGGAEVPDTGSGGAPDQGLPPDMGEITTCAGHDLVDLNAWLADHAGYDGTTAGAPETLAASCGGAAGGEVVFKYRVNAPLDRITFRTDHPETQAPTVLYVRTVCDQPVDLACNRGAAANPGARVALDAPVPGTYYVVVDTGSRDGGGAFRLTVEENGASACRDTEDNDADDLIDLFDPGCEAGNDDNEVHDPDNLPACADAQDNDADGTTDYPADSDCAAAGGLREGPVCALDVPTTDVDVNGGIFPTNFPLQGLDQAAGRCWFEAMPEHLFILTLDRAATVTVTNRSLRDRGAQITLFARSTCDQAASELACVEPHRGSLSLRDLEPGVYFVFAEASQQREGPFDRGIDPQGAGVLADIEFRVRPIHPVCSDTIDNDRDGLVDLADTGCVDADDEDEEDPPVLPYCANDEDDDGDGQVDFPADEGCSGAGDRCEEAGLDLCDGVCQDVLANAAHCGHCGNACAPGVECIGGFCGGRIVFEGPRENLPLADLIGWELCWSETYADSSPIDDLLGACDGEQVLVGCRPAGSDMLQLAAMGDTGEAFRNTGDNNDDTNEHNGVGWYFSESTSIGFVPAGSAPRRESCDTSMLPDWGEVDDGTASGRMCWHTGGGVTTHGFRCGLNVPRGVDYERLVFTTPRPVVPMACGDAADNDGDDLVDALDPGCDSAFDPDEADLDDAPTCANGVDDDEDGQADFPDDPDCVATGDPTEAPRCGLDVPVTEVGQAGGRFVLPAVDGQDGVSGSCGDGFGRAQVLAITLDDPSDLRINVSRDGEPLRSVVYLRRDCDDPESEVSCRATQNGELRAPELDRGIVYAFVERSGVRADLTVEVTIESNIRQCNDLADNDEDGLIDAADVGCRSPFDDLEVDDPEVAPECADGADNDDDGALDYPQDDDCETAGDPYERALCQQPFEVVELPAQGGIFPFEYPAGPGLTSSRCGDGPTGEAVFLLHLEDPSRVEVGTYPGGPFGEFIFGTTYIRSVCDDPAAEVACGGDQTDGRPVRIDRLEPGDYFIFSEHSFGWEPGDPNILPELRLTVTGLLQACENRRDDDGDGLIDASDLGCEAPGDNDERDAEGLDLRCANEIDDDEDGQTDWPADDGCAAAGDLCEEVEYIQCDGVCLDGQTDAVNCGQCGIACDEGVECINGWCGGAVPVFPNDAFGHHGSCEDWNQCINAQGCADAACRIEGYPRALDWEEGSCQELPNQGIRCNLFFGLPGLDYEADYHGCELPVAYNILCAPN